MNGMQYSTVDREMALSVSRDPARSGRPRLPEPLLGRCRLARALDVGIRRPVTLVCAGAGWGKTTLVASWARARAEPAVTAWLTVEARHDDAYLFWSDVATALRNGAGTAPTVPEEDSFVPPLAAEFRGLREDTVLVLDDVHMLRGSAALEGLAGMLRGLPDRLRVVLIGRTEPPVGLHRLRLAGELTEIRTPHLAFRTNEAAELLEMRGRRPSIVQAGFVVERTEGWPVGLRLLAGPFLERGDDGLAEFPDPLRDYLVREVIDAQRPEVRAFLLRTSVADEIGADLATALTGEEHSEKILERLERANAFVVRVNGPAGPRYRYRRLLREALRRELEEQAPAELSSLHVRTAHWYAGRRMTAEALTHAAAARDWPLLGRLTVEHALPMASSRERGKLADLLGRIPPERFADTPQLALCAAVLLLINEDHAAADEQLMRVRTMLTEGDPPDRLAMEPALQVWHLNAEMRANRSMPWLVAETTRLLADLGRMRLDKVPALLQYRAMTLSLKGVSLFWSDQAHQADRYLWAASAAARTAGVELSEISSLGHLAMLVYLQGSLREAERYVTAVEKVTTRYELELTRESAPAHFVQALIELERNRVTEAQEALRRGVHASGERPSAALQFVAMVTRARLLLSGGEPEAARELQRRFIAEADSLDHAPLAVRWLRLAESEADLVLGEPAPVIARYRRPAGATALLVSEQAMLARAYELAGQYEAAEKLAARIRDGADAVSAVTGWVVTALVADAEGHARRSADALAHAVLRADAEGIRLPFHRFDSRRMVLLAERQRWLYEERGPATVSVLAELEDEQGFPPLPAIPDTLSERERDVLRYLPSVLTASEIAADLNISVNTVKAHMRAIYRKLGAARRREAVVRARQTGLL